MFLHPRWATMCVLLCACYSRLRHSSTPPNSSVSIAFPIPNAQCHAILCAKHPDIEVHATTCDQTANLLHHSIAIRLRTIGRASTFLEH
jgi:hypothetical protein